MKQVIKASLIKAAVFILILVSVALALMLPACKEKAEQPQPKRIVGIDSEKTYLRSYYLARVEFYDEKALELPIISRDEIKEGEIEEVKLDYYANTAIRVVRYELVDGGAKGGYYYYKLYAYMTANYLYSGKIEGVTVVINGEDYEFSTDILLGCANLYPADFLFPSSCSSQQAVLPDDNGKKEIIYMVSISGEIEITDVSFQTSGLNVVSVSLYKTGEDSEINLPYTVDGNDLRLRITYTEPDDCLYCGSYINMTFKADGKTMTYTSALDMYNVIFCLGSALK
ncbi:MAG: hypothetical protein K2O41_05745 [Clostridia bacterium]|nr:hypothetical protein [Clostridia bacterium]